MKKCKTVRQNLLLHLDGVLSDSCSNDVKEHLRNCEACSRIKDQLDSIYGGGVAPFPRKHDPLFFTKVEARLKKRKADNELPLFRLKPALLAAAVIVPLFVGVWLGYATYRHQSLQTRSVEMAAEMHQMLTTPGYATLEAYPYGYTE
jgi:anti-sigma factor RsiW